MQNFCLKAKRLKFRRHSSTAEAINRTKRGYSVTLTNTSSSVSTWTIIMINSLILSSYTLIEDPHDKDGVSLGNLSSHARSTSSSGESASLSLLTGRLHLLCN